MRASRFLLLIALAFALPTLTVPAHSELSPHREQKCCCCRGDDSNLSASKIDHDCGGPVKSEDRQCCPGCPLGLAIIPASDHKLVFPKRHGEKFGHADVLAWSRVDRPPVPPPRA